MESESQCVYSVISKQQVVVLLQFNSDVFLVGEKNPEFYDELTTLFGRRRVQQVDTVEDLNSFNTNRSKIGISHDVSELKGACTSMSFSVAAFRKIIGPGNNAYTINGKGLYNSFALNCRKIFLAENAKNSDMISLITKNNGLLTFTPEDADLFIYLDGLKSKTELQHWLVIRKQLNPAATLLQAEEFTQALNDPNADMLSIKEKGNNGILRNVSFYRTNLPQSLAERIEKEGGTLSNSLASEFLVVSGKIDEDLSLLLHHNQRKWAFVDESAFTEALVNEDVDMFLNCLQELPHPPKFHSVGRWENLYLYPDTTLSEADKKAFNELRESMGFKLATSVEESHGIISPVVIKTDHRGSDNPPRRNISCLREMKEKGSHNSCPCTHFSFLPQSNFSVLKNMNIVGIKAEQESVFFIQRVLEGSGIKVAWKSNKEMKNAVFLDCTCVKDKIETLKRLEQRGVTFIKSEMIFQVLSCSEEVSIEKFTVNLQELSCSLTNTLHHVKSEIVESPKDDTSVGVVAPSPELFPSVTKNAEPVAEGSSSKRVKLDWNDRDQCALISKTRDLFGLYVTHQLRFSNLQLDMGTVYTKELHKFPVSDSPLTMSIAFRADNLKTNTGVINDFSKCLTQCNQSPVVGGVFYDYTEDLVNEWGRNLIRKVASVLKELGFRNLFCRENTEPEKGMDLFMLMKDEQVNLCCFRTQDNRFDPEVSSAPFCAARFWIPEHVIEVISTQNRLHFALTCPHIIIYCGDDDTTCFCKKPPMEMCGKIVQHTFHVPENAPKLTRKGAWAYFKRTGEYSGEFSFERMGESEDVQAANYEELAEKLVVLMRRRKWDKIIGEGKASCLECGCSVDCIMVTKIDGVPLICYKCGKHISTGKLVC